MIPQPDPDLTSRSNLPLQDCERLRQYLVAGGQFNAAKFLRLLPSTCLEGTEIPAPAEAPPSNGIYRSTAGKQMTGLIFLPLRALKAARPRPSMP